MSWRKLSSDSLPDNTDESQDVADKNDHTTEPSKSNQDVEASVESGKLNFSFQAFNEDIVVCGAKGSGKSYLANELLKSFNNITCIVWDFNFQFHDARSMLFHRLEDLLDVYDKANGKGRYILQPFDKSQQAFEKLCDAVFRRGNIVLFLDELHLFCSKQSIIKPFQNLILSGRPRGISVISISTRPASLPNAVLSNASHVFAFRLNIESDVKFLESWMGSEVWQLMPVDKRQKMQSAPTLPEHTFYYRNQSEVNGVIGKV